jgi:SAM-dependent methyltransferase
MPDRDGYLLRDRDRSEIQRLRFQHQVWREVADAALDEAGFGPGDAVADLGCGPGFLTADLLERVGPAGHILAVDRSEHFIGHLQALARQAGQERLVARTGDITEPFAEPGSLDGAVCRWVLMFLRDPVSVISNVAACLKPGGRFVALEYLQLRAITLHPTGPAFDTLYGAVHRLIAENGGDPDIGRSLPGLLLGGGLEVTGLRTVLRVGRPGSSEWAWLEGTHPNHVGLVEAGLLTESQLEAFHDEWDRASSDPRAFFTGPPVLVAIARKPE